MTFQGRYVRTPIYEAQESSGEPFPLRRAWTNRAGGWFANVLRTAQNPANTSVQVIDGPTAGTHNTAATSTTAADATATDATAGNKPRLLALCEGGKPYELDPATLATLPSPFGFGGKLTSLYSAHPSIDPATGDIWNHG